MRERVGLTVARWEDLTEKNHKLIDFVARAMDLEHDLVRGSKALSLFGLESGSKSLLEAATKLEALFQSVGKLTVESSTKFLAQDVLPSLQKELFKTGEMTASKIRDTLSKKASSIQDTFSWMLANPELVRHGLHLYGPYVDTLWVNAGIQIRKMLGYLDNTIIEKKDPLDVVSASIRNPLLRERVLDVKNRLAEETALSGKLVGTAQYLDYQSSRSLLASIVLQEALLYDFREQSDEKNPELYATKVASELTLPLLGRYLRQQVRGKYTYAVYVLNSRPVLLYDGWLIARHPNDLDQINSLQEKPMARLSFKLNKQKTANKPLGPVLRCTFTSNARLTDAFLDWMRSIDAVKIGRDTWDIPAGTTVEQEEMLAQLKRDWGFPFVYEQIETVSRNIPPTSVNTDGSRLALRRFAFARTDVAVIPRGAGFVVKAPDPLSTWCGGRFPTEAAANQRAKWLLATAKFIKQNNSRPEEHAAAAKKLQAAADLCLVANTKARLEKAAQDVRVARHFVFADQLTAFNGQALGVRPSVNSNIELRGKTYWVTDKPLDGKYAWFPVEDEERREYVVTYPDENSNVAVLPQEAYEQFKSFESVDPSMNRVLVPQDSVVQVPTQFLFFVDDTGYLLDEEPPASVLFQDGEDEPNPWTVTNGNQVAEDRQECAERSLAESDPFTTLTEHDPVKRLQERSKKLTEQEAANPNDEVTLYETLADSSMRGLPSTQGTLPASLPVPGAGGFILQFPKPFHVFEPNNIYPEQNFVVDRQMDPVNTNLVDQLKIPDTVEFLQRGQDGFPPEGVTFGPHPDSSHRGPHPGDIPDALTKSPPYLSPTAPYADAPSPLVDRSIPYTDPFSS